MGQVVGGVGRIDRQEAHTIQAADITHFLPRLPNMASKPATAHFCVCRSRRVMGTPSRKFITSSRSVTREGTERGTSMRWFSFCAAGRQVKAACQM